MFNLKLKPDSYYNNPPFTDDWSFDSISTLSSSKINIDSEISIDEFHKIDFEEIQDLHHVNYFDERILDSDEMIRIFGLFETYTMSFQHVVIRHDRVYIPSDYPIMVLSNCSSFKLDQIDVFRLISNVQ